MFTFKKTPEGICIVRADGQIHRSVYPTLLKAKGVADRMRNGLALFQPVGQFAT